MDGKLRLDLLLSRITYKNGWRFETHHSFYDSQGCTLNIAALLITHPEPDVTDPRKTVMVTAGDSLTGRDLDRMTDRQIVEWIFSNVARAEMHEVREWLKFDGLNIENPHPPPVSVMTETMWKSL